MAQVHVSSKPDTKAPELRLCHTSCVLFSAGSLKGWLWDSRLGFDRNPNDVVTLVLVSYDFVSAREIKGEYSKADNAH
jgi:hypothetical protein